ncbi:hypothetical protein BGZ88_011205 [Linnemannia elongata]|nr:hypothetical protein BGZ88_011205 [Linnemannia elongata]
MFMPLGVAEEIVVVSRAQSRYARDYKQAMRWLLKAAQQENDVAEFNICLIYNNGHDVPQDYTRAPGRFSKAADQGCDGAKRELEALKNKDAAVN